jgi:hypothetical protein
VSSSATWLPVSPAERASARESAEGWTPARREGDLTQTSTRRRDDWPRTKRPLPWLIAFFLALVWLVPVDSISLTVNLPFDMHLDRIVLPFIIGGWGLALAAGGPLAPRLKLTKVHIAIGIFLLASFMSVVVNTGSLNQALALKDAIKGLLLLSSWVALFAVAASIIRRTEVQAFLKYILILGVICGIGVIVEYRLEYNAFYSFSQSIFTGLFVIHAPAIGGHDELGRVVVLGPTAVGLEVASMLAMALPIALIGLMHTPRRRHQFVYGLAACILLAGGLATYKKTSVVAPAITFVTIGMLWPRRVLRLVPIVIILFGAAHLLAPGALGSVIEQFTGGQLTAVGTTVHRLDGYDAIRPIVWSHPILGVGVGGYNSLLNRILDNQMLDNLIQTGLVGEFAFVGMILTVVGTAVPLIRKRTSDASTSALAAACAAVCFLTVSFLFDSMAYTHVPYIFLTFAALLVVLQTDTAQTPRPVPRPIRVPIAASA